MNCLAMWTVVGMWHEYQMEFLVVGWELTWDLDVWDKSGGYGMRNMKLLWDRRNSMSLMGRSHGGV